MSVDRAGQRCTVRTGTPYPFLPDTHDAPHSTTGHAHDTSVGLRAADEFCGTPVCRIRTPMMPVDLLARTAAIYVAAAVAEIAGCFSLWAWLRLGKSGWLLLPGVLSLVLFAWLLTRVDAAVAGRAYAAYGGVYIIASLAWLWMVEDVRPDRWDLTGAVLCLAGAAIILLGQHATRAP